MERANAPATVNEWLDTLMTRGDDVVGLAQVPGDGWCAVTVDEAQRGGDPQCIEASTGNLSTLSARIRARQAAVAERRGAMSEGLYQHLRDQPSGAPTAVVWARSTFTLRDGETTVDHTEAQDALLKLCAQQRACEAQPLPGVPAVSLTAPPGILRMLARHERVGAMDWVDPSRRIEDHAGGEQTMECIRIDDAMDAAGPHSAIDGTGISISVLEGSQPTLLVATKLPAYGTNAPFGLRGYHSGQVLSVLNGDSSGYATPRAIDGAATGAQLSVSCLSAECFPCTVNADCQYADCNNNTNFCDYNADVRYFAAMDWAVSQGADVINASNGLTSTPCGADAGDAYDWHSRALDYHPTTGSYPVVTTAAGNRGLDRVSSGALHNGLVAGAVNHNNLGGNRPGHTMWDQARCAVCEGQNQADCQANGCTRRFTCAGGGVCNGQKDQAACTAADSSCSWVFSSCTGIGSQGRNRIPGGLEVPHVVAPGQSVLILREDGTWSEGSGTSYAAPHTAGLAARVLQLTQNFMFFPEAVRAIILATATQNITGASLRLEDGVDDVDGAGEIDAFEAQLVADSLLSEHQEWCTEQSPCSTRGVNWGSLVSSQFSQSGNYYQNDLHFSPGPLADTAQIALTWMVDVTCSTSNGKCSGDPSSPMTLAMWLWKKDPSVYGGWRFVDYSMVPSGQSNYLFIRANVEAGAQYKLRFNYPGKVDGRATYYGLAWTTFDSSSTSL
jgi:hypothetical protein